MRKIRVSIITPMRNEAKNVQILIPAILNQKLVYRGIEAEMEIIAIDSGSTDGTVEILKEYSGKVSFLRIFEFPLFHHSLTRNFGARIAKGDILIFINADAVPLNGMWLIELIWPLLQYKDVVASFSRQVPPIKPHFEVVRLLLSYPTKNIIISKRNFRRILEDTGVLFSTVSCAIWKRVFEDIGGFSKDVPINEDQELAIRLLKKGYKIAYRATSKVIHAHLGSCYEMFRRYMQFGMGWGVIKYLHKDFFEKNLKIFSGNPIKTIKKLKLMATMMVMISRSLRSLIFFIAGLLAGSIGFFIGNIFQRSQ